jgi:hypothetical protein
MFTVRMYLRDKRGRNQFRLSNPNIRRDSVVHISVTEATELQEGVFTPIYSRFIGAANFTVHNIAPADGHVDFIVTIDWPEPLNIVTDISIFDPVPMQDTIIGT